MDQIFQKLSTFNRSGLKAAFCLITNTSGSSPRKIGSKMIVYEDGTIDGTIGGGAIEKEVIDIAIEAIKTNKTQNIQYKLKEDLGMVCGGSMDVYIEPILPNEKLIIFGAGHIGKVLARYSSDLGFAVTVVDEREGILNETEFPDCTLVNKMFTEAINELEFDDDTYIVILTHKHVYDSAILKLVCKKKHYYLGMIGSKIKVAEIKKQFIKEKITTEKEFNNIDTPIGIPIKSETPKEIAISILARLIDSKNNKNI